MNGWWVTDVLSSWGPAFLVSWIVWIVVSITLHELSHGWAAIRLGDDTPIHTGHMTWNPVVHLGVWSLLIFALIGIAWGAMPVDPSRLRGRHGDAKVAFAGPLMNIGLALVCCVGAVAWAAAVHRFGIDEPLGTNVWHFFYIGAFLNVVLAVFNLLPVPPLDGSRIVGSFSPEYARFMNGPNGQWVGLGMFVVVFWTAGQFLWPLGQGVAMKVIGFGLSLFGVPPL